MTRNLRRRGRSPGRIVNTAGQVVVVVVVVVVDVAGEKRTSTKSQLLPFHFRFGSMEERWKSDEQPNEPRRQNVRNKKYQVGHVDINSIEEEVPLRYRARLRVGPRVT
ncbi:hypothetical protein V1477_001141 [Vespula maculifrons]|uniref:Uncharacterized protein n=1 Tax=Vespula maculifrons TaxID=7453 RepID=A0ABD2CZV3_VESMC